MRSVGIFMYLLKSLSRICSFSTMYSNRSRETTVTTLLQHAFVTTQKDVSFKSLFTLTILKPMTALKYLDSLLSIKQK